MKKYFFILIVVLFALCNSINIDFENGIHIDTRDEPEQISTIKAKWQEYKPRHIGKRYKVIPSISAPYGPGELTETFLIDGLNMTKFVRYLAGVSEDVVLSNDLCDQAQYGAVLLARTGCLTRCICYADPLRGRLGFRGATARRSTTLRSPNKPSA